MKFNLEIDNGVLEEEINRILINWAVDKVRDSIFTNERYSYIRKIYKDNVQKEMRAMLKEHEAEIVDRAVKEAGAILARKAWPGLLERMLNTGGGDDAEKE